MLWVVQLYNQVSANNNCKFKLCGMRTRVASKPAFGRAREGGVILHCYHVVPQLPPLWIVISTLKIEGFFLWFKKSATISMATCLF